MEKKSKKIRFSEGDLAWSPVREVSGKGISDPGRKNQARARLPSEKETVSNLAADQLLRAAGVQDPDEEEEADEDRPEQEIE